MEADAVVLEVRTLPFPTANEGRGDRESGSAALQSTPYLELGAPALRKALREALGNEPGSARSGITTARRLTRWVRDAVDETSLDVGFATAAEVARDRKGDCTEHAVLLAALLRAAGIPSRVRAGLLYVPGGFGYHLWTQARIGDRWVDLDPTLGDEPVDAVHLGLATSDLGGASPLVSLATISRLIGNLKIEVLEVGHAGSPR